MKQIKYSPDAADKLRALRKTISLEYGAKKASEIVGKITKAIRGLVDNEKKGPSAEEMFGKESRNVFLFLF